MAGLKIKKGDRVRVLTGKDRGKEGTVLRAFPTEGKLIVEGVNTAKKH
jgi:large subunit ribosomal protein L24